ncbi:MAG: RecQ family ATP-dependent DNA helicase [Bacteroidaceae bacterium]|nr:RecQ family ATP-dependent DNA helicase [Bacteroidaceae bacterium]MBQ9641217.1 RecQ family ATP-dependent DNA helicase [Bacteroidaceae bacterium]
MDKYLSILKQYWGYDSFRGVQSQIIHSIAEGHDTLGLMPTGGGKSICFQVPALALGGLCIVVTPLISLMKDQVRQLRLRGIKAEAVYSGMTRDDIVRVLDNCILGDYAFLYVSPERLSTPLFRAKLTRMSRVSILVVDEAHCISQWGYDFRPDYLRIAQLRPLFSRPVPVLALTATATPQVVQDIQDKLQFRAPNAISMSFERQNLIYVVRHAEDKVAEIVHILQSVPQGSAIIYIRSRQLTREIAHQLTAAGLSATSYHAGLSHAERAERQADWTSGKIRTIVATNAFGMGIDKPDVRLVIHYAAPDSFEAYYQEAGRAGRDGQTSYAILLYDQADLNVFSRRVTLTYPPVEYIQGIYESLCYFFEVGVGEAEGRTFLFSLEEFCRRFRVFGATANSALVLLHNAGYIQYTIDSEFPSRVQVILRKEELYTLRASDKNADLVLTALLRNYTGLFAEPVPVEEAFIAKAAGLTPTEVYLTLKQLGRQRVIHFIPHRACPTVTFLQPRVETAQVQLPASVYLDRRADFVRRGQHVVDYVRTTDRCRSRMLLEYFGETSTADCGQCDVCLNRHRERHIRRDILSLLADGQPHPLSQLEALPHSPALLRQTLHQLLRENVTLQGNTIQLSSQ